MSAKRKRTSSISEDERGSKKGGSGTDSADAERESLFLKLEDIISSYGFTELHTHLMGMGDSKFWVETIIMSFIPRMEEEEKKRKKKFVKYPLKKLMEATGFPFDETDLMVAHLNRSLFEAAFFDGFHQRNLHNTFKKIDGEMYISNADLVTMLKEEADKMTLAAKQAPNTPLYGTLRAIVSNWFEFLSSNGGKPSQSEVMRSCESAVFPKTNFSLPSNNRIIRISALCILLSRDICMIT